MRRQIRDTSSKTQESSNGSLLSFIGKSCMLLSVCCVGIAMGTYLILLLVPTVPTTANVTESRTVLSRRDAPDTWHDACLANVQYTTHDDQVVNAVVQAPMSICNYGPYGKRQPVLLAYALLDPSNVKVGEPVLSIVKLLDVMGITPMLLCCFAYVGAITHAIRLAWYLFE